MNDRRFPDHGTAEWWTLRKQLEEAIATQSRRRKVKFTEAECARSELARLTALGDEDAQRAYERNGFTREQWLAKWNPKGKCGGYIPTDF